MIIISMHNDKNVEIGDIVLHEGKEKMVIPGEEGLICLIDLHSFKKFITNDNILDSKVDKGEIKLLIKHKDIVIRSIKDFE